jgi:hypothetical protein
MDSEIAQRAGVTDRNLSPTPELAPVEHAPLPVVASCIAAQRKSAIAGRSVELSTSMPVSLVM